MDEESSTGDFLFYAGFSFGQHFVLLSLYGVVSGHGEVSPYMCLRSALHYICSYIEINDILSHGNCARCVNCCIRGALRVGMERFDDT